MNLKLEMGEYEKYLWKTNDWTYNSSIGIQYIFKFDNHYGASVVKAGWSDDHRRDLWELAVLLFNAEGDGYHLVYDTPVAYNDVLGCLTDEDVRETLHKIREL